MKRKSSLIAYVAKNMGVVLGLVLVWRGVWYILDGIDRLFFSGNHFLTALGGIIIGLAILYVPDRDLKELQKL